jgi:16S rRNA (guanine527-N7)-methyltransferase
MEIILKYFTDFSPQQLKQFTLLDKIYKEWNEKINVISRKDIDNIYEKHVLHSLSIAAVFDFEPGTGILDIGTGGGFPGIPLAIYFPEVQFHLIDSVAKKIKVVNAVAVELGLKNVTTQQIRAEDLIDRKFDFVISRAVAPLKDLWTWSQPLIRHKNQGKRPKEQDSRHKAQDSRHKAQGSRHKAQDLRHKAQGTSSQAPGLISLKGGDLTEEIRASGTQPRMMEIYEIYKEDYFREKYLLFIPAS